jgi:hypothetical protein
VDALFLYYQFLQILISSKVITNPAFIQIAALPAKKSGFDYTKPLQKII